MKYKAREYARALSELMDSSDLKDKSLIDAFIKLLEKNGELRNTKKIIDLAEKYYLYRKGNKKVIIETARKISAKNISKAILIEGDILEEKINKDLIAGVKITVNGEKQVDFSLRSRLDDMFSASFSVKV